MEDVTCCEPLGDNAACPMPRRVKEKGKLNWAIPAGEYETNMWAVLLCYIVHIHIHVSTDVHVYWVKKHCKRRLIRVPTNTDYVLQVLIVHQVGITNNVAILRIVHYAHACTAK